MNRSFAVITEHLCGDENLSLYFDAFLVWGFLTGGCFIQG